MGGGYRKDSPVIKATRLARVIAALPLVTVGMDFVFW